jgi:hypothetical protein
MNAVPCGTGNCKQQPQLAITMDKLVLFFISYTLMTADWHIIFISPSH